MEINRALTGAEISQLLDGKVEIMTYPEIANYKTIDELLEPYGRVALLYMSRPGFGHWTLLHKLDDENVELFDSYGLCVDDELDFIDKGFRKRSNQMRKHLTRLMIQPKYKIHFNDKPLQALTKGIATCGRWIVCRAVNNEMSASKFAQLVRNTCKKNKIQPDELVTNLVSLN